MTASESGGSARAHIGPGPPGYNTAPESPSLTSARREVLASAARAVGSSLKRRVASVWPSGVSLTGSMGGCPPLGEARGTVAPASRKVKYGAANSSSQKPVLRPVLPSWSWEVSTMRIFITGAPCLWHEGGIRAQLPAAKMCAAIDVQRLTGDGVGVGQIHDRIRNV